MQVNVFFFECLAIRSWRVFPFFLFVCSNVYLLCFFFALIYIYFECIFGRIVKEQTEKNMKRELRLIVKFMCFTTNCLMSFNDMAGHKASRERERERNKIPSPCNGSLLISLTHLKCSNRDHLLSFIHQLRC